MDRFDLLGPLPVENSTTVLEASAGHRQDVRVGGSGDALCRRGGSDARPDAAHHVRPRREPGAAGAGPRSDRPRAQRLSTTRPWSATTRWSGTYSKDPRTERATRQQRLRDALASFDAATIATTHQFCQLVLKSLGVAGDTDAGVTLVESLDDLVTEIVDDLYLAHFGQQRDDPVLTYKDALRLAREVVNNPSTELRPLDPDPDSRPAVCIGFAKDVLAELETRKRRLGILGYDDLLIRLADALKADDSPAQIRMHRRWPIVMVDEFQDTDPVQWQVIDRAFSGRSTVILIGDPKQAIYAFRGGDIVTYLKAAETAGDKQTLGTNWRSDGALVDRLQVVLRGAELGDPRIVVHDVDAYHQGSRLAGAPQHRSVSVAGSQRATFGRSGIQNLAIDDLRGHIGRDLAADIRALLASDATFDGEPLRGPRRRGDRREPQGRPCAATVPSATQACRRCTPATRTCSARRPPRTGWRCWRRSTSRTARAWCEPRRRRCSSARRPRPWRRVVMR